MMRTANWLWIFVAALVCVAQTPPGDATIRVPVRLVDVPVAVTARDGSPVRDLRAEDFRLFDNGRGQKVQLSVTDQPLSVAVVVQTNHDVRAWLPAVRRAKSALEALLIGENGEASLTTFNDEVKVVQPMTAEVSVLDKAFNSLMLSGDKRRCLDAVMDAAVQLEKSGAERRKIILIAGQPADVGSTTGLAEILTRTERGNITVYQLVMPLAGADLIQNSMTLGKIHGVALGNGTGIMGTVDLAKVLPEIFRGERTASGADDLVILSNELGGRRIPFRKLRDLEAGIAAIGRELHTEYVLSYTPGQDDAGYHQIRVEVNRPEVTIRARPGYYRQ